MLSKKQPANSNENIAEIEQNFANILEEPDSFLCAQPEKYQSLSRLLQQVYRLAIDSTVHNKQSGEIVPVLVLEGMHDEQIWQQLELRNNIVVCDLKEATAKMVAVPETKLEIRLDERDEDTEEEKQVEEKSVVAKKSVMATNESNNESSSSEIYKQFTKKTPKANNKQKDSVDDQFFKLREMEAFLEAEDAKEMRRSSGKINDHDDDGFDYFEGDFGDDEETTNPEYKDFFQNDSNEGTDSDEKKKEMDNLNEDSLDYDMDYETDNDETDCEKDDIKPDDDESDHDKVTPNRKHSQEHSDSSCSATKDDNDEKKPKSSFELRQERMKQHIEDYENEILGEKPWQLKGEIRATNRPQNSLLEEVLEFDSTTRSAPIITEETTRRLEDIIRQRIKDKAWDDVVLKVKPIQTPHEFRKQLVLDQEKSKKSLAHIYEKEYQNELEKLDPNHADKQQEEPKIHIEIRNQMRELFIKLDALSNFHFSPKPVMPEAKIVTNTPAINMEEVAPVAVSDAKLLAPEEVFKGVRHALVGKTERTKTDKNRERRKKKQKQRAIHKALEAKVMRKQKEGIALSKKESDNKLLKNVTKHRNVKKINANGDQTSLKSSKAFFSTLQNTSLVPPTVGKASKKRPSVQSKTAKKLKL